MRILPPPYDHRRGGRPPPKGDLEVVALNRYFNDSPRFGRVAHQNGVESPTTIILASYPGCVGDSLWRRRSGEGGI
jgi:hypothetical protein